MDVQCSSQLLVGCGGLKLEAPPIILVVGVANSTPLRAWRLGGPEAQRRPDTVHVQSGNACPWTGQSMPISGDNTIVLLYKPIL
jgi:hypothetical protein